MITPENFPDALRRMGFSAHGGVYEKRFPAFDFTLKADLRNRRLDFSTIAGGQRNDSYDDSRKENLVVFECVNRLLDKGYRPDHIVLEQEWHLGHDPKSGRADICVNGADGKTLFIIECKTFGKEYQKELANMRGDGGQLFSYWQQEKSCQWLILYASDDDGESIRYTAESVDCGDDKNILIAAQKDPSVKLYQNAHTNAELFAAWDETYDRRFCGDVVFREDTVAYQIGVKPLRKKDLADFGESSRIVNRFEEILRHNNVSDKENAFNRLTALFICKLVDEIKKGEEDIVEFQYKVGTDSYESLQDRLQRLHRDGMEQFMREQIFYISDDYAENLVQQYTGQNRKGMIADLKATLRILKFYTNNDFAFKDVHNEELFYQNGKILVEVVQLFQGYRIIGSRNLQTLGDLFEQLLSKGFKQNEGQFFTPVPITRFIWDSLPLDRMMRGENETVFPKIMDYACGAGHFLTEGFEAVNAAFRRNEPGAEIPPSWAEHSLYGVEKDYRLARVSKISLFMHGAGGGNIIFGDGLENDPDKGIAPGTFDILTANPPYAVHGFKPHLKLKNNRLEILSKISNSGSEIETLFAERIAQLLKPGGAAAVILPSAILNKENESFIAARETLLQNFHFRAIAQFGSKTFGATGTNTIIVFLEKFQEPPKRIDLVSDSVEAILEDRDLGGWEDRRILDGYLRQIGVEGDIYRRFIRRACPYTLWRDAPHFGAYVSAFEASAAYANKRKQKNFSALPEAEQMAWYDGAFYDFALRVEAEKLTYFALVYRQTVLIITAPEGNKEQEAFLGYAWSNRKGQEGIQIKTPGGMLYRETDRIAENTLAAVIRKRFSGEAVSVEGLEAYYHDVPLRDLLDFSGANFSKAIRTAPARETKEKPGNVLYHLDDGNFFDLSIGDRVLSSEITPEGKYPVYSANVFEAFGRIDRQNLTDFSRPSVLWGIDGDWMVNYIPANQPFYPTDHCGVLRVKTPEILPEYMALALRVEGEYAKFSRSNRASIRRVGNLAVSVPPLEEQKKIAHEIGEIDRQIREQDAIIENCDKTVNAQFAEYFGFPLSNDKGWTKKRIGDLFHFISRGKQPDYVDHSTIRVINQACIYRNGFKMENVKYHNPDSTQKALLLSAGNILINSTGTGTLGRCHIFPEYEDGYSYVADSHVTVLKDSAEMNPWFFKWWFQQDDVQRKIYTDCVSGSTNQIELSKEKLSGVFLIVPPRELQEQFSAFAQQNSQLQLEAVERKAALLSEREEAISRYFRE